MPRIASCILVTGLLLVGCGGSSAAPAHAGLRLACPPCPYGAACVADPQAACDPANAACPGTCVAPVFCGGLAAIPCPAGQTCVDDPRDDCDPGHGGADCGGLCAQAQ